MNDLIIIPLASKTYPGHHIIIDHADAALALQYHWIIRASRTTFYAFAWVRPDGVKTRLHLHQLILGNQEGVQPDHINGDGLDCRRANLRWATPQQNLRNRCRNTNSSSPYKCVHHLKVTGRWTANIKVNDQRIHLGTFGTPEEAARAYDSAARMHFGEFARLNFPE